jgi:hypothetical protein
MSAIAEMPGRIGCGPREAISRPQGAESGLAQLMDFDPSISRMRSNEELWMPHIRIQTRTQMRTQTL